jgi:hypothetical protein
MFDRPSLLALTAAGLIAAGGSGPVAHAGGWQDQARMQAKSVRVQDLTVKPEARREYAEFWKSLPPEKASALERRLQQLERRAAGGENVDTEVRALRQQEPELDRMDRTIWTKFIEVSSVTVDRPGASGPGALKTADRGSELATVECTGIGWIGRNGQPRCIGKLVVK